ncbi:hypothetical protein T4B_6045 [Trichinella pseudospiralis]|uniref:Uncharacterized protein n=1 Tax=Trichinella pseudospiralis TaxID=6337 RepID=A0A0V1IA83_TRIPS|nr:hypothetical protein T4A_10595 [Trichinella pseudospiralis]KRZ19773.1 hypothetical protein T4B_6045 [Trichinella pseudospiralis]KRZ39288.1 hypothetical protein T4C_5502 [Trichinella pseudospiralis]
MNDEHDCDYGQEPITISSGRKFNINQVAGDSSLPRHLLCRTGANADKTIADPSLLMLFAFENIQFT